MRSRPTNTSLRNCLTLNMQLKFFTIPILSEIDGEEKINSFLHSVKVLEIKRELVAFADSAYWAVCVLYMAQNSSERVAGNQKEKVDYKELLSEKEFKRFCQLRKIRKQLADEDAVPAFAVFTDSELSEICRVEVVDLASLRSVNGIGAKKIEKYGVKLCEILKSLPSDEA